MTVSYELYSLVTAAGKFTCATKGRREEAMTEAQTLEKEPHIERVRVVREQYNTEMNASRETVIYETVLGGDSPETQGE